MPSILTTEEKTIVKRVIPTQSNKIAAVGLIRLYVAYPDNKKWTFTGLEGAIALVYDKLSPYGIWLRLVDISPDSRGVIWEQEVPQEWEYTQARTFMHTFEAMGHVYGLSFADDHEAKHFKRKMDERERNAPIATRSAKFSVAKSLPSERLNFQTLVEFDPRWREHFGSYLNSMGIDDDYISQNQEFIVDFLQQNTTE